MAVLLVITSVTIAFAAASKSKPHKGSTPAPRPLKYACASNLYNAKKVLHFVTRPSKCKGSGKTLVSFAQDYPVYVCRKEHGGFVANQRERRRFPYPLGIRPWGPAGLIRLVGDPSDCAPGSQPNETAVTLPQTVTRLFCAARNGGELRWVSKVKSCDKKEFPVLLAKRSDQGGGNGSGDPVAFPDKATTDEHSGVSVAVLANDKNTPTSSSNAGLSVDSIDTTGTIGKVTVNGDGTIGYSPDSKFEALKPGQSATDTFKYVAKKGSHTSTPATVTITITGVNDTPVATDDSATTDSAHTKSIAVLANDTDADGDTLSVGTVDKSATQGNVTVNGDGTVTYDPNHKFDSLAPNDTATDTFKYKASDGTAESSLFATVTVTITGLDDAPTVTTTSGSTAYTENAAATVIDAGVTTADPDDTHLESGQVRISAGFQPGDTLAFSDQNGITGNYNNGTGVLTLTGHATKADYQTALASIQFSSSNDNPGATKTVEFKVNDGTNDSNAATKAIAVTPVNDAPAVDLNGAGSGGLNATASFTEDSPAVGVAPSADVTDPDSNITSATITLTTRPDGAAEALSINTSGTSITASSYNSGTGVLTLSGSDTPAHYQQVLRTLKYDNSDDTPTLTDRNVDVKVNDGALDSNTPHSTVSVAAHNDAPVANDDAGSLNEDGTLSKTAGTGVLSNDSDVEGSTLTAALVSGPSHAVSFGFSTDGSYTYNPNPDYCGPDSFTYKANDGTADSNTATVSITVTCVNDAPVTDLNGTGTPGFDTTASFTEDSPAASVAPAADLTDVDNANLASATITLTNHPDGAAESLAVTTTGTSITASSYNSGTGVLTLSGTDTVAHYQQVVRTLKYDNTSNTPDTTARVVNVKVNDGSVDSNEPHSTVSVAAHNDSPSGTNQSVSTNEDTGLPITLSGTDPEGDALTFTYDQPAHGVNSGLGGTPTYQPDPDYCGPDSFTFHADDGNGGTGTGTVSITVTCVNDAPVTDLNGTGTAGFDTTASFTEDSPAASVAPAADLTDVDNANLASATITLTNHPDGSAEALAVTTTGTSITAGTYDSGTGVLTLSGTDTRAHYQQVLRTLKYDNTSNAPDTTDRVVKVKVSDGLLDSNEPHSTVSVAAHNDAPTANDQSTSTSEDTAKGITLTGGDVDGNPITFHSDQPAHGSVSPTTGSSVTYTPDLDYCGPDSFTFHTNDGTVDSANATVSITVTCVNDAPVADLNGTGTGGTNSSSTFFEATGNPVQVAPNADVVDVDTANMVSATITLTNRPDGDAQESLAISTTGTTITSSGYNSSTGVITLSGTASKADYSTVLRTLTYDNSQALPNPANRQITVVVNDGALDSATSTANVSVLPINAPPVLDLNNGTAGFDTTASFTEDSGPATLALNAEATDTDNANLASATITITNRPDGGAESLSANVAGTSVTADAYVPATGVLFLHGIDTKANYQQVLRTVAYNNTSDTPSTTNRAIEFKVNDGQADSNVATADTTVTAHNDAPTATDQSVSTNEDTAKMITLSGTDPENDTLTFTFDSSSANGGTITGPAPVVTYTPPANYCGPDSFGFEADDGNGGTDSGTISITVTCVNDAPVVDLNGGSAGIDNSAAFTEDQPAVTLATGAVVTDVDSANLASATVILANHPDGDSEGLTAVTAGTSITADSYDTGTGVLFLHGSDTLAHYQQVLRSVAYNNTSNTPDTSSRDITWKVNDGTLESTVAHTTLSVTAANDAPSLDLNGGGAGVNETASYTEDQPATTLAPNTLASDPDDANLESATVTLTNHPDGAAETLSVDTSGTSITPVAYNTGTGVLSLSGTDTVAHYQQVLRTIKYLNTSQNANATNRVVNFLVNDGSNDSNSPTVSVTITVVNDPPVVDMNGGGGGIDSGPVAFTEDSSPTVVGSGPVNLGSSATVSDVDNSALSSATLTVTNHPDGVNESLSVTIPGGNPITTGGYNASTGVLQLTGNGATTAQFQTVIQSAKYNNVSNTPDPTNRDVTTKVNDGAADSTVAHTTVTVTPTNDAPVAGDETFNSTNSAIGNTTLNVNDTTNHPTADGRLATPDPTDTSPVTDRPHKEISGDIFANDTDADNSSSQLTVVAGTFATNDGGTVTIESDGDFNFEPAPSTSCTDTSDFFDYTVQDNGSPNGTDTGRVTIAITGCVWYVNNNDAQGNSGTSEKPFDSLAQAQTASNPATPSTIGTTFVYDGNDTTTGYNTGYSMNSGESLLSEGATLTIGSDTLHTADAANKASITNNNADVVTLAEGTTVKGFNIDPQGTGGGVFGGSLTGTSTITLDDLNVTDNGTKGTQPGLELASNTATTTTNVSNLTVNNGDGLDTTSTDKGVLLSSAGTVNFASSGTISLTTNGARALDATSTNMGTASTFDDITVTNSGSGGILLSSTTGSGTSFGDGSGTDLSLTTTAGAPPAFSIQTSGSVSVPSAGIANLSATGGPAADIVSPTATSTFAFDDVDSTNSANDGINLDGLGTGTFSATSGDIGGESGIGFDLNGGSGAITYPGNLNNGSGPLSAEVTGRSGGTVTLSGQITDTSDTGGGISFTGNTGATAVVTNTNNVIDTGNARAINIANTTIGSSDVNFKTVSSNGAPNGILLDTTGSTGGLNVASTGSGTCNSAANAGCTGGSIQNSTSAGIDLNSVGGDVNLSRISVNGGGDDGIQASSVGSSAGNGIALANSFLGSNGNAAFESGLEYDDVLGISSITNTISTGNFDFNADIASTSGTGRFTVDSSTFSSNSITGGSDGMFMNPGGSGSMRALIQNSTFSANRDDAYQLKADGDSNMDLTFSNNTVHAGGNAGAVSAHAAINLDGNTTSDIKVAMTNTLADGADGSAIILNPIGSTATFDATLDNVTVGTSGTVHSGSASGHGIWLEPAQQPTSRVVIKNSHINGAAQNGIQVLAGGNTGADTTDVTLTNNVIRTVGNEPLYVQSGVASGDTNDVCADIGGTGGDNAAPGNDFAGQAPMGLTDVFFNRKSIAAGAHLRLPGFDGNPANLTSYIQGRNVGSPTVFNNGQNLESGPAQCAQPASPTAP